ncbi:hypothetical protein ASPCADRAFT_211277 [Aspergillus carbonarius ITEM 5010]|uniref:Uncharacterized protein n=1 Tax=Aspergillus carbonarius (strain ITEM 5010) TaxID=602072 RepID=A0A1R3RAH4_ASPC5|nr:hypothetical protein ASPCADRAFT_211277 [Aspergillus carbonarius ITEM 5010]
MQNHTCLKPCESGIEDSKPCLIVLAFLYMLAVDPSLAAQEKQLGRFRLLSKCWNVYPDATVKEMS